jgi:hypothetical protein
MRQLSYRFRHSGRCVVLILSAALVWAGDVTFTVSSPLLALPQAARKQQVEARLAPTALAWPGGQLTAGEAVALLAASGNPTLLMDPKDAARTAELPALSGNYWQGVIAICSAFELAIEPGEGLDQADDNSRYANQSAVTGTAVIATGGPLMLRGQAAGAIHPLYLPCGPVLAEVEDFDIRQRQGAVTNRTANARIAFRLEPRVPPAEVGATLVSWKSVEDQFGRRMTWSEVADGTPSDVSSVALSEIQERFTGCTMSGQLSIQALESVSLIATVKLGEKARVDLLGQEVSVRLLGEGDTTANGQRGPGFSLSVPTAVLGIRPKLSVTMGGQPLKFNNQGSNWSGSRIDFFYRGPKQIDGACVVTVTGQAVLQQVTLPIRLPIVLDRLPRTERPFPLSLDLQIPTRLRWDAGECTVGEAVKRLGAANQVLLELGADERRRATLPAFEGNFWEGVFVICRAFDLTILPPSQVAQSSDEEGQHTPTCITGGPLCLGKRQGDRSGVDTFQSSGILMMGLDALTVVTNQGLGGVTRQAELSYRLRLEPRLDPSLIGSAMISWTSLALSGDGRPLVVEEPAVPVADGHENSSFRFMRVGKRMVRVSANGEMEEDEGVPVSGHVMVSGLPAEKTPLHLSGQVSVHLFQTVRAELSLAVGGRAVGRMGERSVILKTFSAADDDEGGHNRPGISVETVGGELDAMMVDVRDAAGKLMTNNGSNNLGDNGRARMLWYFAGLDNGPYTVVVTAREPLGSLRVPFTLNATTP